MKRILIVEDNTPLALEWKAAFELNDAVVTICHNGDEALMYLESHKFDLVITDIFVNEGRGGLHVLLKLFQMGPSAPPAIAVTGARGPLRESLSSSQAHNVFLEQASRLGSSVNILKPFPAAELVRLARELWASGHVKF